MVAAGPAGVRVRTRLHLTEEEAATLGEVGMFLGSVYRRELAHRITLGRMDRKQHGRWRAERKQAITVVASSRWAGAITRTVEGQYQLGMRALTAEVTDVRTAIGVLEQRCALRPGEVAAPADVVGGPRRHSRRRCGAMPVLRSGFPRPGAWLHCGLVWWTRKRRCTLAGRRSPSAVTGCGAPANISTARISSVQPR